MCKVLGIPNSSYYYSRKVKDKVDESVLKQNIREIFRKNRNAYGTRKIKSDLKTQHNLQMSRRRIAGLMKELGLVSKYTVKQYRPRKDKCNQSKTENLVKREFNNRPYRQVVASDLTYVRVGSAWNYICVFIDLFNREIIGYSAGKNKTAELVKQAFMSIKGNLGHIQFFHTDRGNEFKNKLISDTLDAFGIKRSLSARGCPYDNAVAEAGFKVIKTEFVNGERFDTLVELSLKLGDYVNWYNNHRIHSSLGYLTPKAYLANAIKKIV